MLLLILSLGPRVKQQKVHLEHFVKDWLIDFADLQKSKHSWTLLRSFQDAQRLSPDVFGTVQDERRTCGRPTSLCAARTTLLSEVVAEVSSTVGVSELNLSVSFRMELSELGIAWTPSSSWTENFLRGRGLSSTCTPAQVVFQVDKVQDLYGYKAVFAEQDASAAQMAAAKSLDMICKASWYDWISVHDAPRLLGLPEADCAEMWIRIPPRR